MRWAVLGDRLPADHNYLLYSALVKLRPQLKKVEWQLGTVVGIPDSRGWIRLGGKSHLMVRCNLANLGDFDFSGQILRVGKSFLQLGEGVGHSLQHHENLKARIITIKSSYRCAVSEFEFGVSLGKQLQQAGIAAMPLVGDRCTIKIKDADVIGYCVEFKALKPKESLFLQRYGLGGRRRMGAGVFYRA